MTGETGMDGARTSIATHDGDAADPWTKTRKTSMSERLCRTLTRALRYHVQNLYSAMVTDGEELYFVFFDICPFAPSRIVFGADSSGKECNSR